MDPIIERALEKAKYTKNGETGFIAVETGDGMVRKIWYHTADYENLLDKCETVTLEQWEWERHGCTNNEEWHRYLNKQLWAPYRAGLPENN